MNLTRQQPPAEAPPRSPRLIADDPATEVSLRQLYDLTVRHVSPDRGEAAVRAELADAIKSLAVRDGRLLVTWAARGPTEVERCAVALAAVQVDVCRPAHIDHLSPAAGERPPKSCPSCGRRHGGWPAFAACALKLSGAMVLGDGHQAVVRGKVVQLHGDRMAAEADRRQGPADARVIDLRTFAPSGAGTKPAAPLTTGTAGVTPTET